jgi:hypothetical protein
LAIITQQVAQFTETPSSVCTLQYDYDDVSLLVTAIRCINNTTQTCWGFVGRITNLNVNYETTFSAGQTTEIPVGNGQNTRLQLESTPRGFTGVEYRLRYPA